MVKFSVVLLLLVGCAVVYAGKAKPKGGDGGLLGLDGLLKGLLGNLGKLLGDLPKFLGTLLQNILGLVGKLLTALLGSAAGPIIELLKKGSLGPVVPLVLIIGIFVVIRNLFGHKREK